MTERTDARKNPDGDEIVLGGVEVHVKFVRLRGDPGIALEFTPPSGADGAPEGTKDTNARLTGLCRATVMNMNDPARLRLLTLVEKDGGYDRVLYRLIVTVRITANGSHETRVTDRIDPAFAELDYGVAARALACRQQIEQALSGGRKEERGVSEERFEILEKTNYPPAIKEHTEEEVRKGLLQGEEFMLIEIQVVGSPERYRGTEYLTFEYIAAMSQKALTSEWMKENIRLISKVCEDTVMVTDNLVTRRLASLIRKTRARELCLYRLSVWYSMRDNGSPKYSIRDQIDPVFAKQDPVVGERAAEARRLAGMVMEEDVQYRHVDGTP